MLAEILSLNFRKKRGFCVRFISLFLKTVTEKHIYPQLTSRIEFPERDSLCSKCQVFADELHKLEEAQSSDDDTGLYDDYLRCCRVCSELWQDLKSRVRACGEHLKKHVSKDRKHLWKQWDVFRYIFVDPPPERIFPLQRRLLGKNLGMRFPVRANITIPVGFLLEN